MGSQWQIEVEMRTIKWPRTATLPALSTFSCIFQQSGNALLLDEHDPIYMGEQCIETLSVDNERTPSPSIRLALPADNEQPHALSIIYIYLAPRILRHQHINCSLGLYRCWRSMATTYEALGRSDGSNCRQAQARSITVGGHSSVNGNMDSILVLVEPSSLLALV